MCKTGKKHDADYNSYSDDDNFNLNNQANDDQKKKQGGKYTYSNAFDYEDRTSMAFESNQVQQKQALMTRDQIAY